LGSSPFQRILFSNDLGIPEIMPMGCVWSLITPRRLPSPPRNGRRNRQNYCRFKSAGSTPCGQGEPTGGQIPN